MGLQSVFILLFLPTAVATVGTLDFSTSFISMIICNCCFYISNYMTSWFVLPFSLKCWTSLLLFNVSLGWCQWLLCSQWSVQFKFHFPFLLNSRSICTCRHCCCCWVASVVSDSVRPHRRQPTRLRRPWDSPGKNTGVGCHFLLQRMKVKSESEVAQLCPTLSDLMDCSLPGSSGHGIFEARVLEWGAIAFSTYRH